VFVANREAGAVGWGSVSHWGTTKKGTKLKLEQISVRNIAKSYAWVITTTLDFYP
jgi:hypothetical protein